jgi:hypothetical protein
MKTYTKSDFHNPEQLTRQQVGAEFRLLHTWELDGRFSKSKGGNGECYLHESDVWKNRECWNYKYTYRVPLATPLPDGTILSSNECCFADEPSMSDDEHFAMMNSARISQSLPPSYLDAILEAAKKPKPRVYCAGSMSAHPDDFNFPAFFSAAEFMESQGFTAINPAQLDIDAGYTLEKLKQLTPTEFQEFLKGAMKRDLEAIQSCDALVLLPGWESSKGARAEKAVAEWGGKRVGYLNKDSGNGEGAGEWWVEWEGEKQDSKPQPDADGWIPHVPGDPMPCDGDALVDTRFKCGQESTGKELAKNFDWKWNGKSFAIAAWRPHQPKQQLPYNSDERAEWGCGATEQVNDALKQSSYTYTSIYDNCGRSPFAGCLTVPTEEAEKHTLKFATDDPKGAAGAKKAPMDLLPPDALLETARAMGHGAAKYGRWNFIEAKVCAHTYVAAIGRHWAAYAKGQDDDTESGLKHLAHIAANVFILLTAAQQGTLNDDRPKLK